MYAIGAAFTGMLVMRESWPWECTSPEVQVWQGFASWCMDCF